MRERPRRSTSNVRVYIKRQPTVVSVDGMSLSHLLLGGVYALPVELATLLIVEGWAEPVLDSTEPPQLPAVRFDVLAPSPRDRRRYSDPALHDVAVAADRRRAK